MEKVEWCNWSFEECVAPSNKWLIRRDCEDKLIPLNRGDSNNWHVYKNSLQGHPQGTVPPNAKCPNCHKQINGVNPYDDGETWRR